MRIFEKLTAKFKKKERTVILARDIPDYMIRDRIIPGVPDPRIICGIKKTHKKPYRSIFER